jgi:uncharacterized membrane protein YbhN (UPF0104 family)
VLVWRLGAGPFVDGLRMTSPANLLTATAITALTTLLCAQRWRLVAARLGAPLELVPAVGAMYRSQLLNSTLPGGVLGDVDRAAGHARAAASTGAGVRSVVWERVLGQAVQVTMTVTLIVVLASPLRPLGVVAAACAAAVVVGAVLARRVVRRSTGLPALVLRGIAADLRTILRSRQDALAIVLTSAGAVTGHLLVFLLAARIAGVDAPLHQLLPLAAVVLLAAGLPTNVAGWGPREGVAAWAFGAAGLGADAGVTTAVVYGVMALVATLPGVVVLLGGYLTVDRARAPGAERDAPILEEAVRG